MATRPPLLRLVGPPPKSGRPSFYILHLACHIIPSAAPDREGLLALGGGGDDIAHTNTETNTVNKDIPATKNKNNKSNKNTKSSAKPTTTTGPNLTALSPARIAVAAPPRDGAANAATAAVVAGLFGLPRSRVSVVRGSKGRDKVVGLEVDADVVGAVKGKGKRKGKEEGQDDGNEGDAVLAWALRTLEAAAVEAGS